MKQKTHQKVKEMQHSAAKMICLGKPETKKKKPIGAWPFFREDWNSFLQATMLQDSQALS